MTSYNLFVGYDWKGHPESERWETLLREARAITADALLRDVEAMRPSPDASTDMNRRRCVWEFIGAGVAEGETYGQVNIMRDDGVGESRLVIWNVAGSGPEREVEHEVYRAFCRMLIRRMHRLDLEVCLNVA